MACATHSKKLRQSDSAEWDRRIRVVVACNVAELFLALTMMVIKPAMYNAEERSVLEDCHHTQGYTPPGVSPQASPVAKYYSQGFRRQAIGLAVIACVFLYTFPAQLKSMRKKSASTTEGLYGLAPA